MSFGDMLRVLSLAAALDRVVRGRVDRVDFIVAQRSPWRRRRARLWACPPASMHLSSEGAAAAFPCLVLVNYTS